MTDISRNDPCPCGSGKKYKKCCMGQDLERKHRHRKTEGFGFNPAAYDPARGREILKKARITQTDAGKVSKLAPASQEISAQKEPAEETEEKNNDNTE